MVGIKLADCVLARKKARLDANKKEVAEKEVADNDRPPPLASLNNLDDLSHLVESNDETSTVWLPSRTTPCSTRRA